MLFFLFNLGLVEITDHIGLIRYSENHFLSLTENAAINT